MKTEQENCTVTVRGIQRVEGDEDVVELVTGGRFTCHGGRWLIRYEESDDTGYGGCHTSRIRAGAGSRPGKLSYYRGNTAT